MWPTAPAVGSRHTESTLSHVVATEDLRLLRKLCRPSRVFSGASALLSPHGCRRGPHSCARPGGLLNPIEPILAPVLRSGEGCRRGSGWPRKRGWRRNCTLCRGWPRAKPCVAWSRNEQRPQSCASPVRGWRIRSDACCGDVCASWASERRRHAKERHVCATPRLNLLAYLVPLDGVESGL